MPQGAREDFFAFVLVVVAGVSFAAENPVVGTWESESEDGNRSVKIYSETHFTVFLDTTDGTFRRAHAGTYVLEGNKVIEKVQRSSLPEAIGFEATHEFTITGDTWHSTRNSSDGPIEETWTRVK